MQKNHNLIIDIFLGFSAGLIANTKIIFVKDDGTICAEIK